MDVGELLSFKVSFILIHRYHALKIFTIEMNCFNKHCFALLQPTPTPKRPNDEDSGDSDEETARAVKMRRLAKAKTDQMMYQLSKGLPKEPIISDKEKEDILRYVETEATEVRHNNSIYPRYRSLQFPV